MIKWDDNLKIGIKIIDDHHKYLFDLCRSLEMLLEKPIGVYKVDDAIKIICDFREFLTFHFYYEEIYLKKLNVSDLEEHLLEHEEFKNQIININIKNIYKENYNELKSLLNLSYGLVFSHMSDKDFKLKNLINK
ncbi:hypothetical protein UT300005_00510 [Clostridium sp. CTA-5]